MEMSYLPSPHLRKSAQKKNKEKIKKYRVVILVAL